LAVTRNRQLELTGVGQHRLRTRAVADIARRLLALLAEMMIQLGVQNPLRQRSLQLINQPVILEHRLSVVPGQQLIQQLLLDPDFCSHTPLLSVRIPYGPKTQNSLHPRQSLRHPRR
jgi:hypothetical protein